MLGACNGSPCLPNRSVDIFIAFCPLLRCRPCRCTARRMGAQLSKMATEYLLKQLMALKLLSHHNLAGTNIISSLLPLLKEGNQWEELQIGAKQTPARLSKLSHSAKQAQTAPAKMLCAEALSLPAKMLQGRNTTMGPNRHRQGIPQSRSLHPRKNQGIPTCHQCRVFHRDEDQWRGKQQA